MTVKSLLVDSKQIEYEWTPDVDGMGGTVDAPGVTEFHANSPSEARDTLFSIYSGPSHRKSRN